MRPAPGWYGQPPPPQPRARDRFRHQLVVALAVAAGGFFLGLTRTRNGLLAIALAWVLIGLLSNHRAAGRRQWVKAMIEYAAVAGLVLALHGAAPTTPKVNVAVDRQAPKVEAASNGLETVRRQLTDLLQRARDGAATVDRPTPKGDR